MPLSKLMVFICTHIYHRLLRHHEKVRLWTEKTFIIQKEIGRGQHNVAAKQQ